MVTEKKTPLQTDIEQWFDEMIENLRLDQFLLEGDVLQRHKKEVYEAMIANDREFIHDYARKTSSSFFIKNLVNAYFIELFERKANPNKIALELSNSKILVWVEINNDDEPTEDALILAAAKVNSDFSKYGFHISTTIVEAEDQLEIPLHYKEVIIK